MSWYRMHRGWMDHPLFKGEAFTRAQAWEWLIAEANWRNTNRLQCGQLSHSIRHLAGVWGWHRARVERFLTRLKTETMIETGTERGQIVITICNYSQYQADGKAAETSIETGSETEPRQNRDNTEEVKKEEEQQEGGADAPAKWSGRIIRLNEVDYHRWRKTYHAIPDFEAELQAADDYYSENPPKGGKWFFPVSRWLKKAHDDAHAESTINYKNF